MKTRRQAAETAAWGKVRTRATAAASPRAKQPAAVAKNRKSLPTTSDSLDSNKTADGVVDENTKWHGLGRLKKQEVTKVALDVKVKEEDMTELKMVENDTVSSSGMVKDRSAHIESDKCASSTDIQSRIIDKAVLVTEVDVDDNVVTQVFEINQDDDCDVPDLVDEGDHVNVTPDLNTEVRDIKVEDNKMEEQVDEKLLVQDVTSSFPHLNEERCLTEPNHVNGQQTDMTRKEKKASKMNLENIIKRIQKPVASSTLPSKPESSGKSITAADKILQKLMNQAGYSDADSGGGSKDDLSQKKSQIVNVKDALALNVQKATGDIQSKHMLFGKVNDDMKEEEESDTEDVIDDGMRESDEEWIPGMENMTTEQLHGRRKRNSVDTLRTTATKDINQNEAPTKNASIGDLSQNTSPTALKRKRDLVVVDTDEEPSDKVLAQSHGSRQISDTKLLGSLAGQILSGESIAVPSGIQTNSGKEENNNTGINPQLLASPLASILTKIQANAGEIRPEIVNLIHSMQESTNKQRTPPQLTPLAPKPIEVVPIPSNNQMITPPTQVASGITFTSQTYRHGGSRRSSTMPAVEIPGLPWKQRGLKSLQNLTERWEAKKKICPHPNCKQTLRTNFQLFNHWYVNHMAPGYCKVYFCSICNQRYKEKSSFVKHVKLKHELDSIDAECLSIYLEGKWEASISEENMLKLIPDDDDTGLSPETVKLFSIDPKNPIYPLPVKDALNRMASTAQACRQMNPIVAQLVSPPLSGTPSQTISKQIGKPAKTEIVFGLGGDTPASNMAQADAIAPKSRQVEGLPWKDRDEECLRNLASAWVKSSKKCPHPVCSGLITRNSSIRFGRFTEMVRHWFRQHMAPGYCKVFSCPCCPTWIKYLQNFRQHLKATHKLSDNVVSTMIDQIEKKWENLIDELDAKVGSLLPTDKKETTIVSGSFRGGTKTEVHNKSNQSEKLISEKKPVKELKTKVSLSSKKAIFLTVDGIKDEMLELLDLDKIPREKLEVPGLPWKGMKEETSQALAVAWEANDHMCPHPSCKQACSTRKLIFAHWHQQHLLPGCGIAYPCYGKIYEHKTERSCGRVFDNKWDLIAHCRRDHSYEDDIIQGMFVKIRAVKTSNADPDLLSVKGIDDVPPPQEPKEKRKKNTFLEYIHSRQLQGETMQPMSPSQTVVHATPLEIKPASSPGTSTVSTPSPLYIVNSGPAAMNTLGVVQIKQEPGTAISSQVSLSASPTLQPTVIAPSSQTCAIPKITSTMSLATAAATGGSESPTADFTNSLGFSSTAAVLFSSTAAGTLKADEQILPKMLWKAILATWNHNKKCPHPSCIESGQTYPTHSSMLGHWLRGHMDSSQGRLFPCLLGSSDTSCTEVYTNADELTAHLLNKHGLQNDDIRKLLTDLKAEWDQMQHQEQNPPKPKKRRVDINAGAPIVLD